MLYLFLLLLEAIILFRIEYLMWGKVITPLNVLMLPFVIATLIGIIYPYVDGDIPHYYLPSLVVWMICLLLFEIPSFYIASMANKTDSVQHFVIKIGESDNYYSLLKLVAFGCILISLIKLRSLSSSLDDFGTDDFSDQYQSAGLFAHLSVLLSAIFSIAIFKLDKHHKSAVLIILGSLIGMYAVGTKSWIIAPILIGYYARLLTGKTKINYKTIILPLIVILLIFFFSYYLIIVIAGGSESSDAFYTYVFNHFIDYVSSGSLTLSLDYKMGFIEPEMTEALFGPLINVIHMITGDKYVNVINPVFIDIGTLGESNVRTIFGTIFAYSKSYLILVSMTLLISFITNLIYSRSRQSDSLFLLLGNCANLVFLTFGFFDFYWLTLTPYEILAIFLLMHIFLKEKDIDVEPDTVENEIIEI